MKKAILPLAILFAAAAPAAAATDVEVTRFHTPETVAAEARSFTGSYLKPLLERGRQGAGAEREVVAAE